MSRSYQPIHSPRYEVTVGGTTYRESGGRIADLVVETTLDGADRVSFTLNAPFDQEKAEFTDLDWDAFSTGTEVGVALGWGGQGSLEPVFEGHVRSVKSDFSREKGPSVNVSGYGLLHRMMRGVTDRSWSDVTVGEVADEVLGEYFDTREVEDPGMQRDKLIQHDQSDYRFVRGLADQYGYKFYAERDTAYFAPRSSLGSGSPVATLRHGERLDSFSAEVNESSKVKTVEVRYWDMKAEKEIVGSASTDADDEKKEVFRIPCRSKKEADHIAETKLAKLSHVRAEGHGEAEGLPTLTAGRTVELTNMGSRFSRNYYVTKATHRIGGSGYRTSFEAKEVPE